MDIVECTQQIVCFKWIHDIFLKLNLIKKNYLKLYTKIYYVNYVLLNILKKILTVHQLYH